jgi:hypothetical protein
VKLPDALLDELARVFAHAAVDAFIAGEQATLQMKSASTASADAPVQAQEVSTCSSLHQTHTQNSGEVPR